MVPAFGGQGSERLRRAMAADVARQGLPEGPAAAGLVSEADLAGLPAPVRRYLRYMGVADRPADWSFQAHFAGRFRLRPGQRWNPCHSWQYNCGLQVARVFHIRLAMGGVVPVLARDAYLRGRGSMRGALLGLLPVADASGPELDVSELVTYLSDAIIFAPSMLLALPVTWQADDDRSFGVTLEDAGHQVSAQVFLDEDGAPVDFSTEDRYAALPGGLVRTRWSTPGGGWRPVGGRPLPARGQAIWHLPDGPFCYADLAFGPGDLTWNLPPGALTCPAGAPRPGTRERAGTT